MVWILLAALVVSGSFFLMVFRQVSRTEERLRKLVVHAETRISRKYGARLVWPEEADQGEEDRS